MSYCRVHVGPRKALHGWCVWFQKCGSSKLAGPSVTIAQFIGLVRWSLPIFTKIAHVRVDWKLIKPQIEREFLAVVALETASFAAPPMMRGVIYPVPLGKLLRLIAHNTRRSLE